MFTFSHFVCRKNGWKTSEQMWKNLFDCILENCQKAFAEDFYLSSGRKHRSAKIYGIKWSGKLKLSSAHAQHINQKSQHLVTEIRKFLSSNLLSLLPSSKLTRKPLQMLQQLLATMKLFTRDGIAIFACFSPTQKEMTQRLKTPFHKCFYLFVEVKRR